MNKNKVILGICIVVLGAAIMITSFVFGIIISFRGMYNDLQVFPIDLKVSETPVLTTSFYIPEEQTVSVWMKYPNREIENKKFSLTVIILDDEDRLRESFTKSFRSGSLRNSSGDGQYYQLGSYSFQAPFKGFLRYIVNGEEIPSGAQASLVLRELRTWVTPVQQIGFFTMGIAVLLMGIGTIKKNK